MERTLVVPILVCSYIFLISLISNPNCVHFDVSDIYIYIYICIYIYYNKISFSKKKKKFNDSVKNMNKITTIHHLLTNRKLVVVEQFLNQTQPYHNSINTTQIWFKNSTLAQFY